METLWSQIAKKRPKEDASLFSQVKKHAEDMNAAFKDQTLFVSFADTLKTEELTFSGIVSSCSYDTESMEAHFEFFRDDSTFQATFNMEGGFISKGSLKVFSVIDLENVLKQGHKEAKEGTVIAEDLLIAPHPSSSSYKTTVLPKDKYRVEMGPRLFSKTGHKLLFKSS